MDQKKFFFFILRETCNNSETVKIREIDVAKYLNITATFLLTYNKPFSFLCLLL